MAPPSLREGVDAMFLAVFRKSKHKTRRLSPASVARCLSIDL